MSKATEPRFRKHQRPLFGVSEPVYRRWPEVKKSGRRYKTGNSEKNGLFFFRIFRPQGIRKTFPFWLVHSLKYHNDAKSSFIIYWMYMYPCCQVDAKQQQLGTRKSIDRATATKWFRFSWYNVYSKHGKFVFFYLSAHPLVNLSDITSHP